MNGSAVPVYRQCIADILKPILQLKSLSVTPATFSVISRFRACLNRGSGNEQADDTKGQACSEPRCVTAKCPRSSEKEEATGGLWGGVGAAGGGGGNGLLVRRSKFRSWKLREGVEMKRVRTERHGSFDTGF